MHQSSASQLYACLKSIKLIISNDSFVKRKTPARPTKGSLTDRESDGFDDFVVVVVVVAAAAAAAAVSFDVHATCIVTSSLQDSKQRIRIPSLSSPVHPSSHTSHFPLSTLETDDTTNNDTSPTSHPLAPSLC